MSAPLRRIVVADNPQAGNASRRGVGAGVGRALAGAGYEVEVVTRPDFASLRGEAAVRLARGAEALVVVGGDGMVSLGLGLVAQTPIPLGIVPTGSGNDTARALEIAHDDTDSAIRTLLEALRLEPRVIDAGRVRQAGATTWFAGAVSAGFDAVVNERADSMRWVRGSARYTVALVRELAMLKPITYDLVVDGEARHLDALLVAVSNGTSIGAGMRITPRARLDDGELDLFVVAPMSRRAFLRVFPRVYSGTHTELPVVTIERVKKVRIEAEGIVARADGERVGPLPVEIDVVPGALRVLAPHAASVPLMPRATLGPETAPHGLITPSTYGILDESRGPIV
ncbi:diacylglycerol kinase family protein [Microbacterium sp. STN6]|uniref:diacylglycerol/lipid kinase family protein n=1 Tax=Microbacterium sp. STN6 TaxID=2995588 RepID=UPI0022609DB4|nr:diacylglycerol kinase family protein [Microbacterium sp. STN6]MCX7522075.1 diacylglycerol kinase family protein [Microbacterium sp. STN6]